MPSLVTVARTFVVTSLEPLAVASLADSPGFITLAQREGDDILVRAKDVSMIQHYTYPEERS